VVHIGSARAESAAEVLLTVIYQITESRCTEITEYVSFFSAAAIRYNWVEVTLFSTVVLVIVQGVQIGALIFNLRALRRPHF